MRARKIRVSLGRGIEICDYCGAIIRNTLIIHRCVECHAILCPQCDYGELCKYHFDHLTFYHQKNVFEYAKEIRKIEKNRAVLYISIPLLGLLILFSMKFPVPGLCFVALMLSVDIIATPTIKRYKIHSIQEKIKTITFLYRMTVPRSEEFCCLQYKPCKVLDAKELLAKYEELEMQNGASA